MKVAMMRHWAGFHPTQVALFASPILPSVTVEDLAPKSAAWDPHLVVVARLRGKVDYDQNHIGRRMSFAQETQDTVLGIIAIDPLEACRVTVLLVEGGLATVAAGSDPPPSAARKHG